TTPTLYNLCTIFGFLTPSLIGFLLLPHFFLLVLFACFTPLARILSCLFYFFLFLLVCVCMCRYRQVWGTPTPTGGYVLYIHYVRYYLLCILCHPTRLPRCFT